MVINSKASQGQMVKGTSVLLSAGSVLLYAFDSLQEQSEWANLDAQKIFDNFRIFHLYTEPCDISPPTELLIALKFCLNDTPYRKFLRMESENKPVTNL